MSTHPGPDREPIYLDYNATTPIDPAAVAAIHPYLTTGFGNPSSAATGVEAHTGWVSEDGFVERS
jgi:cysteine desulfurase